MYTNTQRHLPGGEGGFTQDTEVLTERGPDRIDSLTEGMLVYALNSTTGRTKLKPLTSIDVVEHDGPLIEVTTRRCDFRVHPEQRLLYQSRADRPTMKFQRAKNLQERRHYRLIQRWNRSQRPRLTTVDITDFPALTDYRICISSAEHGHTFRASLPDGCEPANRVDHVGYYFDAETFKRHQETLETLGEEIAISGGNGHHHRPYRFDGDDFIELLGWFVTEGSVTWRRNRDTATIGVAQKNPRNREKIRALFERLNIPVTETENGFSFGSALFGQLLESLCGSESRQKRLPEFVWSLPSEQQQRLFDVLQQGDANDYGTYYTSSERLARDVCRLHFELGIKPRYSQRQGIWQVYPSRGADNFDSETHVRRASRAVESSLFQLTVEDFSAVMAGRGGKFQWIAANRVE